MLTSAQTIEQGRSPSLLGPRSGPFGSPSADSIAIRIEPFLPMVTIPPTPTAVLPLFRVSFTRGVAVQLDPKMQSRVCPAIAPESAIPLSRRSAPRSIAIAPCQSIDFAPAFPATPRAFRRLGNARISVAPGGEKILFFE
jgi:hypothetical protein